MKGEKGGKKKKKAGERPFPNVGHPKSRVSGGPGDQPGWLYPEPQGGRKVGTGRRGWFWRGSYVHPAIYYSPKRPGFPRPHTPGPKQMLERAPLVAHGEEKKPPNFNLFIAFNSAPVSTHLSLQIAALLKPLPLLPPFPAYPPENLKPLQRNLDFFKIFFLA